MILTSQLTNSSKRMITLACYEDLDVYKKNNKDIRDSDIYHRSRKYQLTPWSGINYTNPLIEFAHQKSFSRPQLSEMNREVSLRVWSSFRANLVQKSLTQNNLRNDLCNYRLGVSLFEEYDPYDIVIGEKTWIDLKKQKNMGEEYTELDNFDNPLLTPSATSKNRKSNRTNSYDGQVDILKYIITHGKYNSLKNINTWRKMKAEKQILPHINIKTYPQFSEEDLNKIMRGWFNVEVLEISSRLKQNVPCSDDAAKHQQGKVKIENSVRPLRKSSRKLINNDKTHFDELFRIINKKRKRSNCYPIQKADKDIYTLQLWKILLISSIEKVQGLSGLENSHSIVESP
ncbi:unnamed protein product [Lepeophtheirus salmonis]|uniref:(salmon louse) hypothetical protein n=1 Tax=Lepeophtheirus salmonis TaxID=72036 RepID=A0A7R8CIP6_LEPSM|nr:unnamed protein product [Lepeophtheirus salmonis]CAF2832390.1 unnamed protein product [Lepeophtheirus salmonis]